jgi:ATP-dependent DNA helicase PIF1
LILIIGTGKSVLLRSIIKALIMKYKTDKVGVTATTGIAAVNIGGQTLHSFAGLTPQSQYYEFEKLINLLPKRARDRWMKVQALVIDEGIIFIKLSWLKYIIL